LIKWRIRGHASVIDSAHYILTVWLDESNITENRNILPSLNSERFNNTMINEVKSSLDTIRKYPKKKDRGRELLVETSIIGNLDPSAGDNAAEDVITNFLNIMENVYQIASKPAHTTLRGKAAHRFSINPDRSEANLVLTTALAASKFLLERIEIYVKTH
jgi:hypothetical protein